MFENLLNKAVRTTLILFTTVFTLIACSSGGGGSAGSDSSAGDMTAPTATITFPTATSLSEGESVVVHGRASDAESEITVVRVNGVDAISSDNFANWQAVVPLSQGSNTLKVETGDMALNSSANAAQAVIESSFFFYPNKGMVLDSANNRLLVADSILRAVLAVDLNSGLPTVISDIDTPDAANGISQPDGLVLDKANNRVLLVNTSFDALLAVDLATGARTIISDSTTPDGVNPFAVPTKLVLDSANNRVLVLDIGLKAVLAVDLAPGINRGARTIISDSTTPDGVNVFVAPEYIVLDSDNDRLLVTDSTLDAVLAVDLATGINRGARTIISNNTTPDGINPFNNPASLVLDSDNARLLVADALQKAVLAVDLTPGINRGARTIISNSSIPGSENAFINLRNMVLDSVNSRLLVADGTLESVLAVDLAPGINSGARTIISDNSVPDNMNPFSEPRSVVLDHANNRALVVDSGLNAALAIDLTTGVRTVISDINTPDNVNDFRTPVSMVLDSANNRLLVVDNAPSVGVVAVLAVDLATGARTIISDSTTPNGVNAFISPTSLVLDSANNRLLVVDNSLDAVLAVDLTPGLNRGARTIISDDSAPDSVNAFIRPQGLVLDRVNNRLLVTDNSLDAVLAVDLTPGINRGARTIISDSSTPDNVNTFGWFEHLVLDSANNRVLVLDSSPNAVLAVDLSSGARTIISDEYTPDDVNFFYAPVSMALDSSNNRLLVLDDELSAIIVVQIESGERVFLSKSNEAAAVPEPKK